MKKFTMTLIVASFAVSAFAGEGNKVRRFKEGVKGQYIVRLADTVPAEQVRMLAFGLTSQHGGKLGHVFERVVPGFEITLPEAAVEGLSHHPLIEYVEQVVPMQASQVQTNAPWHLDRLDTRPLYLDGRYNMYCNSTPVYAYVVDTGIRSTHKEFWTNSVNSTSRVVAGRTVWAGENDSQARNPCPGASWDDACPYGDDWCLSGGHGTAVASVLGGLTYGAAKHVSFISVRALNCAGQTWSNVAARAYEWIYADRPSRVLPSGLPAPAVVNLSFGGKYTSEVPGSQDQLDRLYAEEWITKLVTDRNITVVAAADNSNDAAANFSPARLARGNGGHVITVGGSTNTDRRWICNSANPWEICNSTTVGSNWGSAVDIFAPSQNIASAGMKQEGLLGGQTVCCYDSDTAERHLGRSGTSFASPIVAGIAAIHLIGSGSQRTPLQIWDLIRTQSSGDGGVLPTVIQTDVPLNGSPNRMIYRQGSTICRM